jgi:hypothetical protein
MTVDLVEVSDPGAEYSLFATRADDTAAVGRLEGSRRAETAMRRAATRAEARRASIVEIEGPRAR